MKPAYFVGKPTVLLHPGAPQKPIAKNVVTINLGPKRESLTGVLVPLFMDSKPRPGMEPFTLRTNCRSMPSTGIV
jgi:hypothetical protein